MDVKGLVAFAAGFLFNEARAKTFDLHPGASLLLDILDKDTLQTVSDGNKGERPDVPEDRRLLHGH